MVSFLICLALLICGYFVYGSVVERTFGPDDRETPAVKINDGVRLHGAPPVEAVHDPAAEHRRPRPLSLAL